MPRFLGVGQALCVLSGNLVRQVNQMEPRLRLWASGELFAGSVASSALRASGQLVQLSEDRRSVAADPLHAALESADPLNAIVPDLHLRPLRVLMLPCERRGQILSILTGTDPDFSRPSTPRRPSLVRRSPTHSTP